MSKEDYNISIDYQLGNYIIKNNNPFDVYCFATNYVSDISNYCRLTKTFPFKKIDANSVIITKSKKRRNVGFYKLMKDSSFKLELISMKQSLFRP